MAPKSASIDPYARAAFLAAQVDSLLKPSPAKSSAVPEIPMPQSRKSKKKHAMPVRPGGSARLGDSASPASHAKSSLRACKSIRRIASAKSKIKISVSSELSFEHHRRKCKICCHPEREAIEELFVHWHSPESIHGQFAIYPPFDVSSIYRHAHAVGLFEKRRKNLRAVFDLLLEQAGNVLPTAHGIVAVIRAYSCLTDTQQWNEPEKRVHITNHVYHHNVSADPDNGDEGSSSLSLHPRSVVASESTPAPASVDFAGLAQSYQAEGVHGTLPVPVGAQTSSAPPQSISRTTHVSTTAQKPKRPNLSPKSPVSDLCPANSPRLSNRQPAELESPPTRT